MGGRLSSAGGLTPTPPEPDYGDFAGNLVRQLDYSNPVAVCDVRRARVDVFTVEGAGGTLPQRTTSYAYDSLGRVSAERTTSNNGGASGGPTTVVKKFEYVWNDAVTATPTSATGRYLLDFEAFADVEDAAGSRYRCTYTSYDGQGFALGQSSGLTRGLATTSDRYTGCGTAANGFTPSGPLRTTHTYDLFGQQVTTADPDANAGIAGHQGCTVGGSQHTSCMAYDATFGFLPTSEANSLNQVSSTGYAAAGSEPLTGPIPSAIAGKCVDVQGNGSADGTPIQISDRNGTGAQLWTVGPNDTVRINGKCMDVTWGGTSSGTKVQLWTCNGGGAQVWQPVGRALYNPQSGRCLHDPNSSTSNGPSSRSGTATAPMRSSGRCP